jgi:hypothetical protein
MPTLRPDDDNGLSDDGETWPVNALTRMIAGVTFSTNERAAIMRAKLTRPG